MRTNLILPVLAALTLTACGSEPDVPKTPDQVKAEMAKLDAPNPGQYRTTIKMTKFDVPGMPAAQAGKMKEMFSATGQSSEFCLTKAQAEKGYEDMTKNMAQGNCTFDRYNAGGGKLDAKMTCETGQGMKSSIEMAGTIQPEAMQMVMKMNNTMPGMPGGVAMETEVSSVRIGDCAG